jgi:hypothetical protein
MAVVREYRVCDICGQKLNKNVEGEKSEWWYLS